MSRQRNWVQGTQSAIAYGWTAPAQFFDPANVEDAEVSSGTSNTKKAESKIGRRFGWKFAHRQKAGTVRCDIVLPAERALHQLTDL